jgi:hypothetical protein
MGVSLLIYNSRLVGCVPKLTFLTRVRTMGCQKMAQRWSYTVQHKQRTFNRAVNTSRLDLGTEAASAGTAAWARGLPRTATARCLAKASGSLLATNFWMAALICNTVATRLSLCWAVTVCHMCCDIHVHLSEAVRVAT